MPNFGQYLKKVREKNGLTLQEVAKVANISASLLSRIENGKRSAPKVDSLYNLAKVLNVSPYEMLFMSGGTSLEDFIYFPPSENALKNMSEDELKLFKEKSESDLSLGNIKKPELKRWYLSLQNEEEEDIEKLKILWEIIKKEN